MNNDHDAADIHGVPDSERLSRAVEIAGGKAVAGKNCTERDIVERIRSLRYVHVPQASQLFEEACQEIERLRSGAVEERETVRLTDAEREAVADAADRYAEITPESAETAATLRGLLERLK